MDRKGNTRTSGIESNPLRTLPVDEVLMDTILDNIGRTPMVRLNHVGKDDGLKCELLAKCEFFNSGGSVKDRIGLRMIEDAERSGRIKPGDTLIEPTSGNTGIGLALTAAIKGYRMIITLPEKMSQEKVDVLKGLGAEVIRTPTEAAFDSDESHIGVAKRLNREIPNSHILDQYANPSNPAAHYEGTAEEIIRQTKGQVDMVVISAGTGGTITGIAKKLKEKLPKIKVVGVDPVGSILAQPESLNDKNRNKPYLVEGIGYDFIPDVLDRQYVDSWVKSEDKESFLVARRLIKEEGLLCGGSSGSAVAAALVAAKELQPGQRCVVVLPDSVRNYMTKFLSEGWMVEKGFLGQEAVQPTSQWWSLKTVSDLELPSLYTIDKECTVKRAVQIFREKGLDQVGVSSKDGGIVGFVTPQTLNAKLLAGKITGDSTVGSVAATGVPKIPSNTPLWKLSSLFDKYSFVALSQPRVCFGSDGTESQVDVITGVVTRVQLLDYITSK